MPEQLVVHCARNDALRFRFKVEPDKFVRIIMLDEGIWLIADPLYSPWLIKFILDNPRAEGMVMCKYEFSPSPGNMQVHTIPIFIKHSDIVRINTWLEQNYG